MPRFTRFVSISSLLLLFLYLFLSPGTSDLPDYLKDGLESEKTSDQTTSTTEDRSLVGSKSADLPKDISGLNLREQLTVSFPYDVNSVFPSFIWQTWKTTPTSQDFEFRKEESTWTEKHTGYIHEVVTDETAQLLIDHLYARVPDVLEAWNALPRAILKADFFRYLILLARGGIYSDIDTEAIRPAWEWVPDKHPINKYGLVVGVEADPDRDDWAMWYSRRVQICQWTMRSKIGHPVLVEVVRQITEKTLQFKRAGTIMANAEQSVVEWTGPATWTDSLFTHFNSPRSLAKASRAGLKKKPFTWKDLTGITEPKRIEDVVVLPITGFSPGQGHMGSRDYNDPQACVKHGFSGTWKADSEHVKPIIGDNGQIVE